MYTVRVSRQGEYLFELEFDRAQLVVGRSQEADVTLPHGTVSRRHACLYQRDGRVFVVDMGSSNGTYINGWGPLQGEYVVNRGDIVYCGIFALEVVPKVTQPARAPERPAPSRAPEPPPPAPPAAKPILQAPVSSTSKTIGPGTLNVADLHAEMARRRALAEAATDEQQRDPWAPDRSDERRGGERRPEAERSPPPREEPRLDEYRRSEPSREREAPPREERRWEPQHRGPEEPTYPAAHPPVKPPDAPATPPSRSWSGSARSPIPAPSFGSLVGPSVMHGPSDD